MVSMGNSTSCCPNIYRSGNMKSVSSSSSGSEKVGGSGLASSVGYDLEESKLKSTSRMSCASDDSCAINELLEGRMDLNVKLPNSGDSVVFNVERRTPMLDLLVNIATQYRFNAANYTISAGDHEFKASTPIGSLDVNQISIIPKPTKSASVKSGPSVIPFKTTFRLQVNLPRNQLMVLRVPPNSSIAAIKQIICSEKSLDSTKYQLVRFAGNSEGPQILELNKTLAYYTLNEVTLVSNKTLTQIEMQFGAPTTSQVDLSASRTTSTSVSTHKKAIHSLIISQSNPDFTTIDDKTVINHTNSKSIKKRPAPPPPMPSSATLPNNVVSVQINHENNTKNDDSILKTAVSESIIETKSVPNLSKTVVNHVRQNSGSDSSGYHESVLSSDSPESSSAVATLPKSSSTTATISTSNVNNRQVINNKAMTKKRRAPPPPSSLNKNQENDNKDNENADENKIAAECMNDVSPPLSTSSSSTSDSSGTASSIYNRSLSPIVITQTNGSSTPRRTSMNSIEVQSEPSSTPTSPQSDSRHEERVSSPTIDHNSVQTKVSSDEEVTQFEESSLDRAHVLVDEELSPNKLEEPLESARSEPIMCQQNDNLELSDNNHDFAETLLEQNETIDDKNDSDLNNTSASITAITTKSNVTETLPKEAEVSSNGAALALAVSHDNDLSGHDCVEQVEERDKSNLINNVEQGSIVMPIISPPLQFVDDLVHYSNALVKETASNNCLHSDSYHPIYNSSLRSYLDSIRRAYLHEMKGDGNLKPQLTGVNQLNSDKEPNNHNDCEIDPIQNMNELELSETSSPLPPPSPFQNSNPEELNSCLQDCDDMGRGVLQNNSSTSESDTTNEMINDKHIVNEVIEDVLKNSHTIDHTIEDTIDATMNQISSDTNKSQLQSETTIPSIISDEDKLNKEIEVTLQSLNDELDRLDSKDESELKDMNTEQSLVRDELESNYAINDNEMQRNTQEFSGNNASKVSVQVKQTIGQTSEIETIKIEELKNMFESRQTPSPTPRVISTVNGKSQVIMNRDDTETQVSKLPNGKTTLIVNKSETPTPPISPQPPSTSPTPTNEDKLTAEEVRQLCRPRVKLTNFSIGSYKKDVDIFEETQRVFRSESPATAPVISSSVAIKPFVVTASVKQEKSVPSVNQNKSKVNITATSTTATTISTTKPSIPVIQTLITTAPKINRIQSWSGKKSDKMDQTKQPVKTNERYVSQIAINKESKNTSPPTINQSAEDLKSPHLVVQSLIARTESQIKNRSPSPQELPQRAQELPQRAQELPQRAQELPQRAPVKELTTISIKPGLESIIRSHPKQHVSQINTGNQNNSSQTVPQNSSKQSITIGKTHVQLKSNQTIKAPIQSTQPSIEQSMQPSIPPPVPPPIPPPVAPPLPPPLPENISSFPINNSNSSKFGKSNVNTKIFHTKGWNSDKVTRNGNVPKVKHVEPPNSGVDVRDALLNEIKSFGGKNTLKKVSKNTSWQLKVNGHSAKT